MQVKVQFKNRNPIQNIILIQKKFVSPLLHMKDLCGEANPNLNPNPNPKRNLTLTLTLSLNLILHLNLTLTLTKTKTKQKTFIRVNE